jgi:DNA-binding MarR family transcriptional regulator
MKPQTKPHGEFLPYLLNRVVSQINAPMQRQLRQRGMTLTQWRVLGFLRDRDDLIISELADHTVTDQATLSRALDRLAERGMIERVVDDQDSRQFKIHLTPVGKREYESLSEHGDAVEAWAMGNLSRDERALLRTLLNQVSDAMRVSSPAPDTTVAEL